MEKGELDQLSVFYNRGFAWTHETIKMLLSEYISRKEDFRNKDTKKKTIWYEIVQAFENNGYIVTIQDCDKKFRNMKATYMKLKRKHHQAGNLQFKWEYFCDFEQIFGDDPNYNLTSEKIVETEGGDPLNDQDFEDNAELSSNDQRTNDSQNNKRVDNFIELREYRKRKLRLEKIKIAEIRKLRLTIERLGEERNAILRELMSKK